MPLVTTGILRGPFALFAQLRLRFCLRLLRNSIGQQNKSFAPDLQAWKNRNVTFPTSTLQVELRRGLRRELALARTQTDRLFEILAPLAIYERPIPERHRIVFYLGHLEAFDWNMICSMSFGASSFNSQFDRLFAFGIDPIDGKLPQDAPADWPPLEEIHSYNQRVRHTVDRFLNRAALVDSREPFVENGQIFRVAIEHRLMHAETLAYMLHWLPYDMKCAGDRGGRPLAPPRGRTPLSPAHPVDIPAGVATLGRGTDGPFSFGWDNEFDTHKAFVPEFSMDTFNVTNGQFIEFVRSGGYEQRSLWSHDAWEWIQVSGTRHPKFWVQRGEDWFYRSMFGQIPLPLSWPVYVSHAEAQAYARRAGKSLPTEAQYHRAAFGSRDGLERLYPWGEAAPGPSHGNFNFRSWTPRPVDAFPASRSAFGVFDLMGNGWEWTSTPFGPFPGFNPFPFYPGYSADFFDGKHFVMKGGSPRTSALLLRRSFRNWFQPNYPNTYATFRCVEN